MTRAKYLADLLALQVLNTDVAHHINRGDCDALADYFVDDAKYEGRGRANIQRRDAIIAWFRARSQAPQAPTRHNYGAGRVVIVDPKSARGSSRVPAKRARCRRTQPFHGHGRTPISRETRIGTPGC